jgi:hypothetical protein
MKASRTRNGPTPRQLLKKKRRTSSLDPEARPSVFVSAPRRRFSNLINASLRHLTAEDVVVVVSVVAEAVAMDHPEVAVATVTSEVVATAVDVDVAMETSEVPEEVPHEVVPDPHPSTRRIPVPSQPLDKSKQPTRPTHDLLKWFDFFLLQNMSGSFGNDPMSKRRKICASCSFKLASGGTGGDLIELY